LKGAPRGQGALLAGLALAAGALQAGEREPTCAALAIADAGSGAVLGEWPLRPGESLAYAYTHSLEGRPAEELLSLRGDGELHLVGSRSPQHGAGHVPRAPLAASPARPGWQEAQLPEGPPLTPFAVFSGSRDMGDPRLVWRWRSLALAGLGERRHLEWRVVRRCR
jgi:hypothetical protein